MIRVCADANILISYLLSPQANRPASIIVRAGFDAQIELVLSETTIEEVERAVRMKPWLRERISQDRIVQFSLRLRTVAVVSPEILTPLPEIVRDPKDNYLVVHALAQRVDHLVTGDKDLLSIADDIGVNIVSPAQFVAILERAGNSP